jgi:hypothetical protein
MGLTVISWSSFLLQEFVKSLSFLRCFCSSVSLGFGELGFGELGFGELGFGELGFGELGFPSESSELVKSDPWRLFETPGFTKSSELEVKSDPWRLFETLGFTKSSELEVKSDPWRLLGFTPSLIIIVFIKTFL